MTLQRNLPSMFPFNKVGFSFLLKKQLVFITQVARVMK